MIGIEHKTLYIPPDNVEPLGTVIDSTPYLLGCVDLRNAVEAEDHGTLIYEPNQDYGAEKSPGGFAGTVMAVKLAVDENTAGTGKKIGIPQIVASLVRYRGDIVMHPALHDDCGHLKLASSGDYEDLYGISA